MSLLTDAELQAIFQEHHNVLAAPGTVMFDDWRRIIAAQQTETLKAVAEWYADDCSVESHPGRPQGRVGCMNCKVMLLSALHAGKMPGEEA